MNEMLFSIKNLDYSYGKKKILKKIKFKIFKNEIVGLLGPNGAGKSTLFKILNGVYPVQFGNINFLKKYEIIKGEYVPYFIRKKMGVVFQENSLDDKLTVMENLNISSKIYCLKKKESNILIKKAILNSLLVDKKNDLIHTLSGGMKRRLELARALMHDPNLLLMDEPTVGLDVHSVKFFWRSLLEYKKKKEISVLFSTHKIDEANICDRIIVMLCGKIISISTPKVIESMSLLDKVKLSFNEGVEYNQKINFVKVLKERIKNIEITYSGNEIIINSRNSHLIIAKIFDILPKKSIREIEIKTPSLKEGYLNLLKNSS